MESNFQTIFLQFSVSHIVTFAPSLVVGYFQYFCITHPCISSKVWLYFMSANYPTQRRTEPSFSYLLRLWIRFLSHNIKTTFLATFQNVNLRSFLNKSAVIADLHFSKRSSHKYCPPCRKQKHAILIYVKKEIK